MSDKARLAMSVVTRAALSLFCRSEIALGAAQGADESAQVFGFGVAVDHRRDHEGRVEDFAETELLGEVIGAAE